MKQIWRKRIPKNYGEYSISFPVGAMIETVGIKENQLCIWFSFDTDKVNEPWVRRNILVTYSGMDYSNSYNVLIGTLIEGGDVCHVLTQFSESDMFEYMDENFTVKSDGNTDKISVELSECDELPEISEPEFDTPYTRCENVYTQAGLCVNGCPKKIHAKGMCQSCYDKIRRAK